jgi:hypothetical protein
MRRGLGPSLSWAKAMRKFYLNTDALRPLVGGLEGEGGVGGVVGVGRLGGGAVGVGGWGCVCVCGCRCG